MKALRKTRAAAGAFLALWNSIDPAREAEYNEWHAREHVPERLSVRHLVAHHDAVLRRLHELPRPGTAAVSPRVVSRRYTLLSMHTA